MTATPGDPGGTSSSRSTIQASDSRRSRCGRAASEQERTTLHSGRAPAGAAGARPGAGTAAQDAPPSRVRRPSSSVVAGTASASAPSAAATARSMPGSTSRPSPSPAAPRSPSSAAGASARAAARASRDRCWATARSASASADAPSARAARSAQRAARAADTSSRRSARASSAGSGASGSRRQLRGGGTGLLGAPPSLVPVAHGRGQRPRGGRRLVLAQPVIRPRLAVPLLGLGGGRLGLREGGLGGARGLPGGLGGGHDRPQALRRRPAPLRPLARLSIRHRQALRGELGAPGQALRRAPQAGGQRLRGREGLRGPCPVARDGRARGARLGEGLGVRGRGLAEPLGVGPGALERIGGGPGPRGAHRAPGGLHLALQRRGPLGGPRLALERPRAAAKLPGDVAGPLEPVGHAAQLELGAVPPALGHGDARGGVHDRPALGRRARAERLDLPLADDRQRVGADAPRRQRLLHVEQAAGRAVQPVVGVPRAGQPAGRLDLRRRRSVHLVDGQDQLDLGHRGGRAAGAARVEDVRHPAGPQAPRALLAERPDDRLGQVALAGPVGTHDDVHAGAQLQRCLIGERLEAPQRETAQHQASDPVSRARASAAAACSDACLEVPLPRPISRPSTSARLVKVRRSGGPSCPASS